MSLLLASLPYAGSPGLLQENNAGKFNTRDQGTANLKPKPSSMWEHRQQKVILALHEEVERLRAQLKVCCRR
jgi:hypothetical protein